MNKHIVIVGCGFVGLSNAFLLSVNNNVIAVDNDFSKIKKLKNKDLHIEDNLMESFIKRKDLNINFDTSYIKHLQKTDYLIISTPTNYDPNLNSFDTESVDSIISDLNVKEYKGTIVIKSTIPIGYTKKISTKYPHLNILFSPEFLRETTALSDNIEPDRIIVSGNFKLFNEMNVFGELLKQETINNPEILISESDEAEAIKLFSNTYLAMRVAFFNELDSFSLKNNLNSESIIKGVSKDKRIGDFYNNPSFGYGGYCLPKDTKQLLHNYENIPNSLIKAIVESNKTRKDNIAEDITNKINIDKSIGIYRLVMKNGSDNFRSSSIIGIIRRLQNFGYKIYIYEPKIKEDSFLNCKIENRLDLFKKGSDLIICNRINEEVLDVSDKLYSRDLFNVDV